jgi:hypothetical protein
MTKKYKVSWRKGRKRGAIGISYPDSITVEAKNPEEAHLKAYNTHEHLMFVRVTEIENRDNEHGN